VNPAEIVVHEIKSHAVSVILNLLAECIRQTSESAHPHPHAEVLALHIACRNVFWVGLACNRLTVTGLLGLQADCLSSHRIIRHVPFYIRACACETAQTEIATLSDGELDALFSPV